MRQDAPSDVMQAFCHELESAVLDVDKVITSTLFQEEAELDRLAAYAALNVLAVGKITKKCSKKFGFLPELHRLIRRVLELPGLMGLASKGLPVGIHVLQQRLLCSGPSCQPQAPAPSDGAESWAESEAPAASGQPPVSAAAGDELADPTAAAAPQLPLPWSTAALVSAWRRRSVPGVLRALIPELLAGGCGAACLGASMSVPNLMPLSIIGLMLLLASVLLLASKVRAVLRPSPRPPLPPPGPRTCVWALAPFGDLLAGRPAELGIEVVSPAGAIGTSAQIPVELASSPALTFAHSPRVEEQACPCCMEEFSAASSVAVPPCGHLFCEPCLRSWAAADRVGTVACPVCRASFELNEV